MALADLPVIGALFEARRKPGTALVPANSTPNPDVLPNRTGFVQGIPRGGFGADAAEDQIGAAQNTTRTEWLQCLWEEYVRCFWSFASVNAIARTVTAGGLSMKWDGDTGVYGQKQPDKPAAVLAMERLFAYCNPDQDIRQLCRDIVADLQVFGGAMIEVVWFAGIPAALYIQDFPTTIPQADEHGNISGYKQITEDGRTATFRPDQIIHISLDSARPSVFGISPTHAAEEAIVCWMFLHACEKEGARRGLPPDIHADLPAGTPDTEAERWQNKYATNNIGPQNQGTPKVTKGGGKIVELQKTRLTDILTAKKDARDEIVATYGVPPAKLGIIESGNLGGGSGSDQNKTFMLDVVRPIAMLIAEKLQFNLAVKAFGITGWHVEFPTTDYRDDKVIADIQDQQVRLGARTLNALRSELGQPPVDGGDDAVLIARQDIVLWSDLANLSAAAVAGKTGTITAADQVSDRPPGPPPAAGTGPSRGQGGSPKVSLGSPSESAAVAEQVILRLVQSGVLEHTAKLDARQRAYNQLAKSFPPKAIKWVLDDAIEWTGPTHIAASQIDTDDRSEWDAVRDDAKVARIKKRYKQTGKMKPIVVVRAIGDDSDNIADGHHHFLAAEQLGIPIKAYVAHVPRRKGPWATLSLRQKRTKESTYTGRYDKDEVGYGPSDSVNVRCGTCVMFDDGRCTKVAGDIDAGAVCSQWTADANAATGAA